MHTIKYLNTLLDKGLTPFESLGVLNSELGIVSTFNGGDLVALNYDQINSPKKHPIVIECRGLILRYADSRFSVVSRSFDRFFNLGENDEDRHLESLDHWVVYEKVDGSLIKVYKHNDQWEISTRGTLNGSSSVNGWPMTFRDLFLRAIDMPEKDFQWAMNEVEKHCDHLGLGVTYIFELATRENRVVTPYDEDQVVLLGARFLNGEEIAYEGLDFICKRLKAFFKRVRLPLIYRADSIEDVKKILGTLGGLQEGFVMVNLETKQRIKLKSAAYLVAHHVRNNSVLTPARISELIVTGEHEEYLSYFPEDLKRFQEYIDRYNWVIEKMPQVEVELAKIESQRDFAKEALKYPFSDVLFRARKAREPTLSVFLAKDTLYKVKMLTEGFKYA
jgi:hypothetical protein